MFFWRDAAGREIDVLLELGETLVPIEAKSGETVAGDFFKGIEFWRSLVGQPDSSAVLVYGGAVSYVHKGISVTSNDAGCEGTLAVDLLTRLCECSTGQ